MPECVSTDIESQENHPAEGDLTVRLHIRLNRGRRLDSGARGRLFRIRDYIQRNQSIMEILEVSSVRDFACL